MLYADAEYLQKKFVYAALHFLSLAEINYNYHLAIYARMIILFVRSVMKCCFEQENQHLYTIGIVSSQVLFYDFLTN